MKSPFGLKDLASQSNFRVFSFFFLFEILLVRTTHLPEYCLIFLLLGSHLSLCHLGHARQRRLSKVIAVPLLKVKEILRKTSSPHITASITSISKVTSTSIRSLGVRIHVARVISSIFVKYLRD